MAQPVIRCRWRAEDSNVEIIREVENGVTFHRGLGNSGRRIQIVEHDCPKCSHDRMVRLWRVNPESRDRVEYYCQNPVCPHYVADEFSWLGPVVEPDFPLIWSQTAVCPDCDERHTVTVDQRLLERKEIDRFLWDDYTHESTCEDCKTVFDPPKAES